jgi:hypothetical protein
MVAIVVAVASAAAGTPGGAPPAHGPIGIGSTANAPGTIGQPRSGWASNARTLTWRSIAAPNITDHPASNLTQGQQPPYRLTWPGEGTSSTGAQDPACPASPPFRDGHRVRTGSPRTKAKLHGVSGISKRGPFVRVGNPTPGANHPGNHLAVFFHTPDLNGRPCFHGGAEYGFLRKLAEGSTQPGHQPLDFYQCLDCNCRPRCREDDGAEVSERYTDKGIGWNDAERDRVYRVLFRDFPVSSVGVECTSGKDNFLIQVLDPSRSPPVLQLSARICRASWLPDLDGASGWITANAHADMATSDGVDGFGGSYNQVTTIEWLSG